MLRGLHGFVEAAEVAGADRAAAKQWRKFQLDLGRERERSFRADEKMRKIDIVPTGDERVEIVAADAALHFRKTPLDLGRFACRDGEKIAHQRLRNVDGAFADAPKMGARTVGQNGVDRKNVLPRIAIAQRTRAAGVIAHHAADSGAGGCRDIDRKPKTRGLQSAIEFVQRDAGFDDAAPSGGIEIDDSVEMPRAVDDDQFIDRLPGLRRSAAACRHRHFFCSANSYRAFGFVYRARCHNAERRHLVVGRVSGIATTGEGIETHLPDLLRFEPPLEPWKQPCWQTFLRLAAQVYRLPSFRMAGSGFRA